MIRLPSGFCVRMMSARDNLPVSGSVRLLRRTTTYGHDCSRVCALGIEANPAHSAYLTLLNSISIVCRLCDVHCCDGMYNWYQLCHSCCTCWARPVEPGTTLVASSVRQRCSAFNLLLFVQFQSAYAVGYHSSPHWHCAIYMAGTYQCRTRCWGACMVVPNCRSEAVSAAATA
jgi:hypothetical protein